MIINIIKNMRAQFVNEAYGQKDLVRMQDIKTKAAGNHDKEISLATTQAKIIQDAGKAQARAEAAEKVFGSGSDISQIFHERAVELGGSHVIGKASKQVLAPVTGPVEKGQKIERKFKTQYLLPSERLGAAAPEIGQAKQEVVDSQEIVEMFSDLWVLEDFLLLQKLGEKDFRMLLSYL